MKTQLILLLLVLLLLVVNGYYIEIEVVPDSNHSLEPSTVKKLPIDFFLQNENWKYVHTDLIYSEEEVLK